MSTQAVGENRKSCDFLNFCLMDIERLPVYTIVMERFIRSFRVSISNTLRKITNINLISTERKEFRDFISTVDCPSFMTIFSFDEKKSPALITIDMKLAYGIIDIIFGGEPKQHKEYKKEITQIEIAVIKEIVAMLLKDIDEAWKPVNEYNTRYVRAEINPQFIGIIPSQESVLVTEMEVTFEKVKGKLNIVVPMQTIFSIRDKLI